ncbi:uncharacterized protein [Littorina saxatilis]|uniref:uncharacterized protein n=1 Tax=Littorina saxatilis TaxID=31220 RepID=UPI0038B56B38
MSHYALDTVDVDDVETADYLEPVPAPASRNAGRAQETPASSQNAALESDDYEDAEAVPGVAAPAVPRGPYETLEMSDMGLRSDYSELGAEEPQAAQGRGDYYSSLQMSNVGVRSDYSELCGHNDTA